MKRRYKNGLAIIIALFSLLQQGVSSGQSTAEMLEFKGKSIAYANTAAISANVVEEESVKSFFKKIDEYNADSGSNRKISLAGQESLEELSDSYIVDKSREDLDVNQIFNSKTDELSFEFGNTGVSDWFGVTTSIIQSNGKNIGSRSDRSSLSTDGRYVAIESDLNDLVEGDVNGCRDIFVFDQQNKKIEIVSVSSEGRLGNGDSRSPVLSGDGRFIAFESTANNMVDGDNNNNSDIFVHDRQTGKTELVSVTSDGLPGNRISRSPSISQDGRFIAFESESFNLVKNDNNNVADIFVYDRLTKVTRLISLSSSGSQANGASRSPSISANGRFVAYESNADNLVDTGFVKGVGWIKLIFVYDLVTGITECVTVSSEGFIANNSSNSPAISGDGRMVAFWSVADNLVDLDTNGMADVFIRDRYQGLTRRITMGYDGLQSNGQSWYAPKISADGNYVTFTSSASNLVPNDTNNMADVFIFDVQANNLSRASIAADGSQANKGSDSPSISADGRFISFTSYADNLVRGSLAGKGIYVFDRNYENRLFTLSNQVMNSDFQSNIQESYETNRKIVAEDILDYQVVSADGRYIAFCSSSNRFVENDTNDSMDVFVYDLHSKEIELVSASPNGTLGNGDSNSPAISADGRFIAFSSSADNLVIDDTNGLRDVFVKDRISGYVWRVSAAANGEQANGVSNNPTISANGRYIAFESAASNLVANDTNDVFDIFVFDMVTGKTERVSLSSSAEQANLGSVNSSISANGRFVAFASWAGNLVKNDTNDAWDIFVHDLLNGHTYRVSVASSGVQANKDSCLDSHCVSISSDGRYIAFESLATNLVENDTNKSKDVFVHDLETHQTERASVSSDGFEGNSKSYGVAISYDGRFVSFISSADNLIEENGVQGKMVYFRDRKKATTMSVNQPSADGIQEGLVTASTTIMIGSQQQNRGFYVADSIQGDVSSSGNMNLNH